MNKNACGGLEATVVTQQMRGAADEVVDNGEPKVMGNKADKRQSFGGSRLTRGNSGDTADERGGRGGG